MDQMQNLHILLLVDTTWWGRVLRNISVPSKYQKFLSSLPECYPGRLWDLAEDR